MVGALAIMDHGVTDRNQLVSALQAAHGATLDRGQNTVDMLLEIEIIGADGSDTLFFSDDTRPDDGFAAIRTALLNSYLRLLDRASFGNLFQIGGHSGELMVNRALLPGRDRCYPYALLEFDILKRDKLTDQFWSVQADVVPTFMDFLRGTNERPPRRALSLERLKAINHAREEAGRLAEAWVVAFERRRLSGHPFVTLVRSVSDEDAGAGFDILSFDSSYTLLHDRFIEVKSYHEEYSFYWSEEEISTARKLGMRYWLYLVDRRLMTLANYQPEMISDPISYFIDREPLGWLVSGQGLKFTRAVNVSSQN